MESHPDGSLPIRRGTLLLLRRSGAFAETTNEKLRFESALTWLGDLLVPPAYAHPGHYIEGSAMGQMLEATTVDLLGDSLELADGDGVTGLTNSARITWQTPPKGGTCRKARGACRTHPRNSDEGRRHD